MRNRIKVLLMAGVLSPFVGLSVWLAYADKPVPAGIIFALSVIAGNGYIWKLRKDEKAVTHGL